MGLGAIQKDELETRRKTNRQVAEVLKRYGPVTTNSAEEETPMELDAIQKEEEGRFIQSSSSGHIMNIVNLFDIIEGHSPILLVCRFISICISLLKIHLKA